MTQNVDLKELEKKAFTSYHQDGLIDIGIGLFVLSLVVGMVSGMIWLPAVLCPAAYSVWFVAKKSITVPRVGYVKFGPERYLQLRKLMVSGVVALSVIVLVSMGMYIGTVTKSIPPWVNTLLIDYIEVVIGVVGAALFVVVASSLGINRFYAYAAITLIIFTGGHLLTAHGPYLLGVVGSLILTGGVVVLIQFLRNYPRTKEVQR